MYSSSEDAWRHLRLCRTILSVLLTLIHMCIYVCVIYIYIYIYTYIYIYVCMYIYTCVYVCVCVYIHVYMCVCVCHIIIIAALASRSGLSLWPSWSDNVCIHIYIYIYIYIYLYIYACMYEDKRYAYILLSHTSPCMHHMILDFSHARNTVPLYACVCFFSSHAYTCTY
jgi:hypothetical protein